MKGYRAIAVLGLTLPLAAWAQAPIVDGSGGGFRSPQPSASVPLQPGAGLSMEGQLMQQLDRLQQEVSMLRGLLEEQEHRLKQMEQDQLERYQDLDRRLAAGSSVAGGGLSAPDRAGQAAAGGDQPLDARAPLPTPSAAGAAPPDPEREKLLYDAAFDLVKTRDFPKAIQAFTAFLRRYPNSEYAGNAQYWLGEVHLAESEFNEAGRAFAQVISNYPGHRKEADAMYKLADVERRLGNHQKARQLYQEVLSKHPNSSAAQLARRDLDTLG
jgi:tol-pal system protein YbgF